MTLREKLYQLSALFPSPAPDASGSFQKSALDLCRQQMKDGMGTMGPGVPMTIAQEVEFRNTVQKYLAEKTRLGIPMLFHDEGCHGLMKTEATSFPMPIGLACCWDEALIEKSMTSWDVKCEFAAGIKPSRRSSMSHGIPVGAASKKCSAKIRFLTAVWAPLWSEVFKAVRPAKSTATMSFPL